MSDSPAAATPAKRTLRPCKPSADRCLQVADHAEHIAVLVLFVSERFTVGIPVILVAVLFASVIRQGRDKRGA